MDREIVKEESMYDFYREQTLLLTDENKELKERIDKAVEYLKKIRQSTFTKYNSNEWNNCLSYNDDILPLLDILEGRDK